MKVSEHEAAAVKDAARLINEQISSFRNVYRTQDDLNIALMCCLKIATDYMRQQHQEDNMVNSATEKINQIQAQLAEIMEKS